MTDILMTTWNRPNFVKRVIPTIKRNTISDYRLIVIDNGSDKETTDLLLQLRDNKMIDSLLLLDKNYGLEFTRQLGLSLVQTERFVTTDSDCLPHKPWAGAPFEPDWLRLLNSLMDKNQDYAAIACRTQIMVGSGDIFGDNPTEIVDFTCGGSLRLMDTAVIRGVGGWDRAQELRGNEEHYICGKLRNEGFKCGFASYVPCYHLFGNENNWGYDGLTPEESGHRDVGNLPHDDEDIIKAEYE